MTWIIRKAELRDIEALAELLANLFAIETDFAIDFERQRAGLSMMIDGNPSCCVMMAEYDRRTVGMCTGQLLVSTAEGGLKAIIEDLVVAEEYRGVGVGSQLLTAVEQWARGAGAKRVDLLADRRNSPALDFYRRRQWRRTELVALQKHL